MRKIKDASEVENGYKSQNGGQLTAETIVTRYQTRTDPTNIVKRGGEFNSYSEIVEQQYKIAFVEK